jgi:hypothetical protein
MCPKYLFFTIASFGDFTAAFSGPPASTVAPELIGSEDKYGALKVLSDLSGMKNTGHLKLVIISIHIKLLQIQQIQFTVLFWI